MNIQIFGKSKCFDTKKAERFFKERKIKYQYVDLLRKGLSPGEYKSVSAAVGGIDALIDRSAPEYESLFIAHLAYDSDKEEKLLCNPALMRTPIVRNGKLATLGWTPEIWQDWINLNK